jgi:dihydroorotase
VGLPVAVHVSVAPPSLEEILAELEAGDIITHSYTPHNQMILDERGEIRPAVRAARERGILFDLGHGAGSFTFEVARQALAQDFPPDTISTDVYCANVHRVVFDLPTTLSKFLNLGMSLEETIARATVRAADMLGEPDLGRLQVGKMADLTLLALREGQFEFVDARKQVLEGAQKLEAVGTVFEGKVVHP